MTSDCMEHMEVLFLEIFKPGEKIFIKSYKTTDCNYDFGLYGAHGSPILGAVTERNSQPNGALLPTIYPAIDTDFYFFVSVKQGVTLKGSLQPMVYQMGNGIYEPYTGGKPSPSPDYPQKIESAGNDGAIGVNVSGKNLIDFDKYYDSFKVGDEFVGNPRDLYKVKIQLPKMFIGKKLTFSALFYHVNEHSNIRCGASIDGKSINGTTSPDINKWFLSKLTFTMVDETDTIYFDYGSDRNVRIKNIMLELGDTVTPYEPYKPLQSLVLQTPNGLPGIPATSDGNYTDENGQQWICDEIDCEKGEYIKRIDCAVLDGVNIKFSDSGPESLFWNGTKNTLHDANQKNIGMSNYLTKGMFAFNSNYDFVFVYKEKALEYFDTVEQFNSFLEQKNAEGNPVKIYYTIENPVKQKLSKKEIEAFKSLHTNYPTTTVLNDAGAWMEMRYLSPAIIPKKEYALRMWFKENPII